MRRFTSVPLPVLIAVLAVVALGAGVGLRVWRDAAVATDAEAFLVLNPECRLASQCMALDCSGRTFVVSSDVTFDVVQRVRTAWCGGAEVTGRQTGVRCGSYSQCVLGSEASGTVNTAGIAAATDFEVNSVFVYPNIGSAFIAWRTSIPADSRVVIGSLGGSELVLPSESGRGVDHRAVAYGLESDTDYTYRIEASFQRGVMAQVSGVFRVLPAPDATH